MKTNHTPGPWELHRSLRITDRYGVQIAQAYYGSHPQECEANAQLMAAAPELLAILEKIISTEEENIPHGIYGISSFNVQRARAAIAKATGADIPKGKTLCEVFSEESDRQREKAADAKEVAEHETDGSTFTLL